MYFPVSIIIREVGQICILLLLGFSFIKIGILKEKDLSVLTTLLLKVALPSMIITVIPVAAPKHMLLENLGLLFVLAVWYAALAVYGYITGRICAFAPNTLRVHVVQSMIGNIFVIGLPLAIAALGSSAGVFIALIAIVDQFTLWFIAVPLSYPASAGKRSIKEIVRPMASSMTAALFIALIFITLGGLPDNIVIDVLKSIGSTTKILAMFFIGGTMALQDLKKIKNICGFFIILIGKMILLPIGFFLVSGLFTHWLDVPTRLALVLFTALPCLASMCFLAKTNGTDYEYANMTMLLTTVSSVVSIPVVAYVVNLIIMRS
jgi:predicted permease